MSIRFPYHCSTLAAIVCVCLLNGCRKPEVTETKKPVSNQHVESGTSESPSSGERTLQRWTLSERPQINRDDPASDGWQTEAFHQQASLQLKQLGEFLIGSKSESDVKSLIASTFNSDFLVPPKLETLRDDSLFVVQRSIVEPLANGVTKTVESSVTLREAVGPFRQSFKDYDGDRKFKFKIIRVDIDKNSASTLQYLSISGTGPHGSREQNATWRITWQSTSPRQPPKIQSIEVNSFEQVTINAKSGKLLTDRTDFVLGSQPAYRKALTTGIAHWRDRLNSRLGVYNLGHHGVAIGDVNGDGRDDIYICQTGGLPNHLFVQQPDGTAVDISTMAGVDYLDNTRSALFIDIDNDGDQDLVLALTTGLMFLENVSDSKEARFSLRARIPSVRQAFSLAAADYDEDGDLDLYVCVYYGAGDAVSELPLPLPYFDAKNGGGNYLIQNQGNWRFEDVTDATGLNVDNTRFSLAATWEDYDNDGDVDLMVVNDYGPNQLYSNDDGRFSNVAERVGLLDGAFGMSATFGDFDRNGRMDLYVSNMFSAAGNRITTQDHFKSDITDDQKSRFQYLARGNSLFRNVTNHHFEDVSESHGVTIGRWSWGSLFADIDNDGWEDLLVANGYVTGESIDDL